MQTIYDESDLSMMIQMESDDRTTVRYYLVGVMDYTIGEIKGGIIYGYAGGGVYQDWLVLDGKVLEDTDGTMEYDEAADKIDEVMGEGFIRLCEDFMFDKLKDSEEDTTYIYKESSDNMHFFGPEGVNVRDTIIPISFGNTYWEDDNEK